jgi:hypothetical protein
MSTPEGEVSGVVVIVLIIIKLQWESDVSKERRLRNSGQ